MRVAISEGNGKCLSMFQNMTSDTYLKPKKVMTNILILIDERNTSQFMTIIYSVEYDGKKGTSFLNATENVTENADTFATYFNVHIRTIKRDLAQLQELGYIRHVGPDKGGRWQVLKTINNKKKLTPKPS